MADPRTFTLIGEFKDGITPELEKINKQLATLKANFAGVGSRKNTGFRGATKEIGKLVAAHKNLASSVKEVRSELSSTIGVLQQYRREMGKAGAATRAFQKAGGSMGSEAFTRNMRNANTQAREYLKTLQQINAQSNRVPRMPRGGMGGGGGGTGRVRPPAGGGRGSGGGGMGAHMGEFGFAYTLGASIAQPIQSAIISGFQIGVGFMTKPFEYFAGAFGERVQDQLSDLKAAGGLFSVSQRSKTPFLKTMDEAVQYQQDTNKVFARMAADLPGVTNDYVQVGKRLSDTMARITSGDFQNALTEANRIRGTEEGRKYYGQTITGTGADAQKQVITTLLGEMTKKTTLAGLGGRTGAGGVTGAYGLPGLTERMLSQQTVSMGQFQRYAAVFSDPTVSDALNRNIDLVNETMPNTAARFKAMQKLLDEVVTPDLIDKLRTSVEGVYQGLKSAIFDPDTGLFGLGRQFENFGYKINQYGQYVVDKEGRKIKDSLSIFEIISNIFSNAGQVLTPIVQNLSLVFDPLKKVADLLMDARHYTAEFARTFNQYREGLKNLSETKGMDFLKGTLDFRSSLLAVNNLLLQVGAIGKGDFMKNADMLMHAKDMDFGAMMSRMLDQLMNSKVAERIGETIGSIVGTVLSEVAKVTGFLSGRIASSNKLFDGLKRGFEAAKGTEAFKNIFRDVFTAMFEVLKKLLQIIPFEAYMLAALAVVAPAVVQGLAMSFASRVWGGFQAFFNVAGARMVDALKNQSKKLRKIQKVSVTDLGSMVPITDPRRMLPGTTGGALAPAGGAGASTVSGLMSVLAKLTLVFAAIVIAGGGVENTFRQLSQALGEIAANLGGAFGGLFDSLGVITSMMGDLGRRINEVVGSLFGAKQGFDFLKIVLGIITLPLQLISQGLRGLAVALANFRLMLAKLTRDPKTAEIEAERNALDAKLAGDRGRINAYNASMLGPYEVKKQMNNAKYELENSKTIGRIRKEELQSFIAASQGQAQPGRTPAAGGGMGALGSGNLTLPANSPAAAAIANTSTQTAQLNQKASVQVNKLTQTNVTLATIKSAMGTLGAKLNTIAATIRSGDMAIVGAIGKAAASGGFGGMGGMGGGMFNLPTGDGVKKVTAAGKMHQGMGLNVAENPYFGDGRVGKHAFGSYHYAGRAIDVTGPPAKLDAAYAQLKNTNPAELLWRTAGHFDHLHVAYALGAGMPAFFNSQSAAVGWERSMVPGSVKVGSVTGNSSEGFGGNTFGNINVTVNAGATTNPDELASIVAMKIGEAVADARAASVFV